MALDKRIILNDRIRFPRLLLIDDVGGKLGEMSRDDAMKMAEERGLDLALMTAETTPPVAKLIDYGKYQYEQKRAARKAAVAGKAHDIKGIRIGLRTGDHDLDIRVKQAIGFIEKGHKVRLVLMFRGREQMHADLGFLKVKKFVDAIEETAKVEQPARKQGNQIIVLLGSKK